MAFTFAKAMNRFYLSAILTFFALFQIACSQKTNMDVLYITTEDGEAWFEGELLRTLKTNEEFLALVKDPDALGVEIRSTPWEARASGLHAEHDITGINEGRIAWSFIPHDRTGFVREIMIGDESIHGPFQLLSREPGEGDNSE